MKPRYSQSFSAGAAKGAEGSGLLERTAMSHVGIKGISQISDIV
jgi:hypothetical protein